MMSRSKTFAIRECIEERHTPYRCQLNPVKSNFSLDGSDVRSSFIYPGVVNSHYNDLTSEILPLMLLPKVQPRTDSSQIPRRPNIVEQCTDRRRFANIASSSNDLTVTSLSRTPPTVKRSQSRDSGISSLKMFSLINSTYSRSTLNESSHNCSATDDGHPMSPYSNVGEHIAVSVSINRLNTFSDSHGDDAIDRNLLEELASVAKRTKDEHSLEMRIKSPEFLDSYADERPTVRLHKRRDSQSENSVPQNVRRRGRNGRERRKVSSAKTCILCNNLTKHFGGVHKFINWLLSRWGKNKDVQRLRYNYVNRGQIPHFCNFVHKMHLYGRQSFTKDLGAGSGLHRDADDMDVTFDVPADPFSTRTERDDSGLMSRPSSPSSLDEKFQDDEDMENAIRNIVGRDSPNSDSDMILAEQLDKNSKSSVKIGAPVIDNRINVIRIPSPAPPVPKQVWSENKIPVNVPKSPVINKYVHDQKGQPSTPVAPPPPPTDNQKPRPASANAAVRKRSRIAKKEKKPFERNRTTKTEEPEKVVQPPPEPTLVQEEESENSAEKTPYVPDFKVPDLPEFKPPEPVPPKPKPERQRQHSQIKYFKPDPREILDLEMKLQRNFFEMNIPTETAAEEPIKIEKKVQPWLHGRIALSKQSSRFELPMDMKILETMSPQEYLRRYCVITTRRQNLYHKMFQRHKEKTGLLLSKDLEKALKDVLTNTITANQISELSDMLEMDDKTKIDYRLFSGIAALAERILYPKYVTEDTADMPEHQREKIECADFCALDWKFHGVDVYPPVRKLLKAIG